MSVLVRIPKLVMQFERGDHRSQSQKSDAESRNQ